MKRILSLGAGVQSSTILMMSIVGELPRVDHAIFADTGWEPKPVYDHLRWISEQANAAGIPVHTVCVGDIRADAIHYQRTHKPNSNGVYASLPLFVLSPEGKKGMLRRQCTERYKIRPISKKIRQIVGIPKGARSKEMLCEQWIGISKDEEVRARRKPAYPWIMNVYPLVDRGITRQDCLDWWKRRVGRPLPRSSCIGCPFHNDREWLRMKMTRPGDFADAVAFEAAMQEASTNAQWASRLVGTPYLHAKRVPLDTVKFNVDDDHFLRDMECAGMCGV